MNNIFFSQNQMGGITYILNIVSTNQDDITIKKGTTVLGTYSLISTVGLKNKFKAEFTEDDLGFVGELSPISVMITLSQGNTTLTPKSVTIMKDTYEYDIDMNEVSVRSCIVSGTVTSKLGNAVSGALIKNLRNIIGQDTLNATTKSDGTYSWSGDLAVGSHSISCSAYGYSSETKSISVNSGGLLVQRITANFQLLPSVTPTESCTLICAAPTKTTRLAITPSTGLGESFILGSCLKGVLFRSTLMYNSTFHSGVRCRVYDADSPGIIYSNITLPANGEIRYFTV